MGRIGTKSKGGRKQGYSEKSMPCKVCQKPVDNVDSQATAVTCNRCVSKSLNPHTIFVEFITLYGKFNWGYVRLM